jgi:hypothetical protein
VSRKTRRSTSRSIVIGAVFYRLLAGPSAVAAPQLSSGVFIGPAANGDRSRLWQFTDLAMGLRAELLLGRGRDADFGLGPYGEALTTTGFSDAQIGGGATLLMPIHPFLPLTFSAGGYARHSAEHSFEPGLAAEIFWGSHGYNYDSIYAMSAGLFLGTRYGLGDAREVSVLAGARLDLEIVALPFIILWQAIRGSDPAR